MASQAFNNNSHEANDLLHPEFIFEPASPAEARSGSELSEAGDSDVDKNGGVELDDLFKEHAHIPRQDEHDREREERERYSATREERGASVHVHEAATETPAGGLQVAEAFIKREGSAALSDVPCQDYGRARSHTLTLGEEPKDMSIVMESRGDQPASTFVCPPMPEPLASSTTVASSPSRHHPYVSPLLVPSAPPKAASSTPEPLLATDTDTEQEQAKSLAGPIRTRRGRHTSDLGIQSTSPPLQMPDNRHFPDPSEFAALSGMPPHPADEEMHGDELRARYYDYARGGSTPPGETSEERTIRMGAHSFTIPLKSPTVAPQLQASVRLTSTGKPSHARKVPEDHVKRPRNAFILFRSYACTSNLLPETLGITDHRQVSRVVGQLWKGLKKEEKAIWEKKAAEEKEAHKLKNPNYRYRPVYRRENVVRRRRKKPTDDDEADEEERKCEVVARVLLEGREVNEEELEREVEEQRVKDERDGRDRSVSRAHSRSSRSRSRSRSVANDAAGGTGAGRRGNSAPPGNPFAVEFVPQYSGIPPPTGGMGGQENDYFLRPGDGFYPSSSSSSSRLSAPPGTGNSRSRAKTMPTTTQPDYAASLPHAGVYSTSTSNAFSDLGGSGNGGTGVLGGLPSDFGTYSMSGRFGSFGTAGSGHLAAPSPRTTANMQQIFNAVNGTADTEASAAASSNAAAGDPFNPYSGLKMGGNPDHVSLLSPSLGRKFSLGRWEIPQTLGLFGSAGSGTAAGYGNPGAAFSDQMGQGNYTYSQAGQLFDAAAGSAQQQPGYNPSATYVYLSKADAQNPEIVNHYLAQGYGVSYDA